MLNYPTKVDGVSTLPAAEYNDAATELKNAVTGTGLALSSGDPLQLAKALTWEAQSGNFYTDSGTANAVILTNSQAGTAAYRDGMRIRFRKGVANTGAVTINVQSMGVVNLLRASGIALATGDIAATRLVTADYKAAVGAFVVASVEELTPSYIYTETTDRTILSTEMNALHEVRMTSASITLTLPALSTVAEGQYLIIRRDGAAAFALIIDGNGAETVGTRTTQELWGADASITIRRINGAWSVENVTDPSISVKMKIDGVSIATATNTVSTLAFESANGGLNAAWYNSSTYRILPLIAGDYLLHARVSWNGSSSTGVRHLGVLKNGTFVQNGDSDCITNAVGTLRTAQSVSYVVSSVVPGDYFQINLYQNSGGSLIADFCNLEMVLIKRKI